MSRSVAAVPVVLLAFTLTGCTNGVAATTAPSPRASGVVADDVASVLVHDLRFTVSSAQPAALVAAIAREVILSDALSINTSTLGGHELDITHTGPLLSDDLVESVRGGIARRAHLQPAAVTISPRSTTGFGVDMAKEPLPPPAATEASPAHHHSASPPAVRASSHSSLWAVFLAAVAALLILTVLATLLILRLALIIMRRINRLHEN